MSLSTKHATVQEVCRYLESDLYRRDGGRDYARWASPLGWEVRYGYDGSLKDDGPVWCEIRYPDGRTLARSEDADVYWLEANLP